MTNICNKSNKIILEYHLKNRVMKESLENYLVAEDKYEYDLQFLNDTDEYTDTVNYQLLISMIFAKNIYKYYKELRDKSYNHLLNNLVNLPNDLINIISLY